MLSRSPYAGSFWFPLLIPISKRLRLVGKLFVVRSFVRENQGIGLLTNWISINALFVNQKLTLYWHCENYLFLSKQRSNGVNSIQRIYRFPFEVLHWGTEIQKQPCRKKSPDRITLLSQILIVTYQVQTIDRGEIVACRASWCVVTR